jgi:hypothetical protein
MYDIKNEMVTIPFTAVGYEPTNFYTYTPVADEMFAAQIMDSSSYPVYFYWGRADSANEFSATFNQPNDIYQPEDMVLESGVTYNFKCGAVAGCSGNFNFTFFPAAESETFFDVPANTGDMLVASVTPTEDSNLLVVLLESNNAAVMVLLKDSAGNFIASHEFHHVSERWYCDQTLVKGASYGLFINNHLSTGEDLTGYLHIELSAV